MDLAELVRRTPDQTRGDRDPAGRKRPRAGLVHRPGRAGRANAALRCTSRNVNSGGLSVRTCVVTSRNGRMSRMLAIWVALVVGSTACTAVTLPSYTPVARTPAPLPSGATALVLKTAPPAASGPGPGWACAESTPVSVGVLRDGDSVVFGTTTGERIDIVWPRGFSAWLLDGRARSSRPMDRWSLGKVTSYRPAP